MPEREKSRPDFEDLADVVALLRQECPWDKKQTHASLRKHLLEETYETLEAIDRLCEVLGSEQTHQKSTQQIASAKSLCDELGDLLYQVFFHSLLASERDDFDVYDVVASIQAKLIRRHPHVFGNLKVDSEEDLAPHWEAIKKSEGKRESVMDGIPNELPALLYASKVQRKAASLGAKPPQEMVAAEIGNVASEISQSVELPIDDQTVGRLLFTITQLAAQQGIDSEAALRSAAQDFKDRFRKLEERGEDLATEETRDYLWGG